MEFEETMLYTCLDIDLNSFTKESVIDEQALVDITHSNLSNAFTCDHLPSVTTPQKPPSTNEIDYLMRSIKGNSLIWSDLKDILFSDE